MLKHLFVSLFFGGLILVSGNLLTTCNNLKKDESKLLTCNVYIRKSGESFEYFFVPENRPRQRIYISRNAQKVDWDNCEVILKENDEYLLVDLNKLGFTIKKFSTFQSLDSFYNKVHENVKKVKLHYSSDVYLSLADKLGK